MSSEKPFYLYKGDDAVFDGINKIEISVTSTTTDLSRFSGMFQLGEFKQIGALTNGFMKVELTREYTSKFLYGPLKGAFRLLDAKGRIKTIANNLNFYITDDISLLEQNGPIVLPDITVDGDQFHVEVQIDVPLTQYGDLEGKPRINDIEINGNKTGDYYGLQQKLTAGDHISLVNDTIGVIVDNELSDESSHPVENQVVKAALDANSSAIETHIADKDNPHEVTKSQVGLGNVDNTADLDKPISTATQAALNQKQPNLTEAQLTAVNSGIDSTKVAQIATNANNISTNAGNIAINTADITAIENLIPNQATTSNQLADKNFVNSSIATNTANFIGTFNSVAELEAYSGTVTNNDYAFVVGLDSDGNTVYNRYKYSTVTTPAGWVFEYALNNSSFTAAQWDAINSGITAALVTQIGTNKDNITSLQSLKLDKSEASTTYATKTELSSKQDTISDLDTIRSGAAAGAVALPLTGGTLTGNLINRTGDTYVKQLRLSSPASSSPNKIIDILPQNNDIHITYNYEVNTPARIVRYNNGAYNDPVLWSSNKAAANGVASLDANTKVPLAQLPVDNALSASSENPVQNKVIYAAIGDVETLLNNLNSGDYNE